MSSQFRHRNFVVKSSLLEVDARQLMDDYLDNHFEVIREFKNNRHNYVVWMNTDSLPNLVIKEPRKRNQRFWQRVMSVFRPGEAIRVYESHIKLQELEFSCPDPVLAAELRTRGFVTYSFFIYRYQTGKPATTEDAQSVSGELQRLHGQGYTRGDPKAQNFLIDSGRVYFIDFKLSRPRLFGRHSTRMEYAHFLHTMPEGIHHLPREERNSWGFRFATWLRRLISDVKRKKHDLRERRGADR